MADGAASPLLSSSREQTSRRSSQHSASSHESTPLLSRTNGNSRYDGQSDEEHEETDQNDRHRIPSPAASSLRSLQDMRSNKTKGRRWTTIIAVLILAFLAVCIMVGVFFATMVEEYAKEALVIEPTSLSIDSITLNGVVARVQARVRLDASRVKTESVRNVGRLGTWLAREVKSEPSTVEVYLPDYDHLLIGTAEVPSVAIDIRNGQGTDLDIYTQLRLGNIGGLRQVANDWLEGRLDRIRVLGKAEVVLQSGVVPLGSTNIAESLVFEGQYLYRPFASFFFGEKILG